MRKVIMVSGTFITLVILSVIIFINGKEVKEENKKLVDNTGGMISYTIDGEIANEEPSKESGYIVSEIECKNGSVLVWDNDNWQVELVDVKSADRCMIDFTKDISKPGYRVTVTSNSASKLDSTSKTTTNDGVVTIYPNESTIASVTGCSGVLEDNKVIVRNVVENQTCNITILPTLADTIKAAYPSQGKRSSFSSIVTIQGMYEAEDNDGISYYLTGNPNNWVSFAGSLWRIIRVNGDESVRLLYAGSGREDGYIGSAQSYSTSSGATNNPAYVGWKYSISGMNGRGTTESYVYQTTKSWYDELSTTDKSYINVSAKYCADRTASTGSSATSSMATFMAATNLSTTYYFGAYRRLYNKTTPSLMCEKEDIFTDGFGLMTADEVVLAGGLWATNNSGVYYYLNVSGGSATGDKEWWTMSPSHWDSWSVLFRVLGSNAPGYLSRVNVGDDTIVIRPVISLKVEVSVTGGDGTSSNPYKVTMPYNGTI